ncbi:FxSxx-COOH system tetratricopeptide repeat protein [Streptomyces sp. NPDC093071]|uniref:FxSxx-COOH system tetratricopeptide repeat protein n=1 Tax=Streptomyces sp. NPDC093071 TaxID=3366022 RepID=UPI003800CF27
MDERHHDEDGGAPVTGELVPLDDAAKALLMGLRPIPDDVVGERRELAEALRRCFSELKTSVRRYAVLRRYSASSVSRYLSGETVAPDHFVNALVEDVGKELGRPMSPQARLLLTRTQRAALKSGNTRAWRIQELEDRLATALQEKALARTMADAVATSLLEHQERVVALEAERQALTREAAAHRAAGVELSLLRAEQHRVLTDHEALRRRVAELEAALEAAERRVALAEQRCADLEHTLLAADAAAVAEEEAEGREAEERAARSQDELAALRREVAALRAGASTAPPEIPYDPDSGAPVRPAPGSAASTVTVVFPGRQRPWAAWIAHRLETNGLSPTLLRWDPDPRMSLDEVFGDLLLFPGRVLLVLDESFFEPGLRPVGEWNDVLRGFVAAHADRFAAVTLAGHLLPSAATVLEPVGIWGIGEEEAEARLLDRLGITPRVVIHRPPPGGPARHPETPPGIWGGVPLRNQRFTGRDDVLGALHERLMGSGHGDTACALVGVSGIGKTQIAAEYAHRFSSSYDVVWWVGSEDRDARRIRFGELAAALDLPVVSGPGDRVAAVLEALRRGEPRSGWLVVFDGWDAVEDVDAMLPHGPGHVLITSRHHAWRNHTDVLEVPGFHRAESIGFLLRHTPQLTPAEADEVAAEVGDVPLPLARAAAWLGDSGTAAAAYLALVRERDLSGVDEPPAGRDLSGVDESPAGGDVPRPSLISWSALVLRLRRTEPQAVDLLALCASFAPGRVIPLGLIRACPEDLMPEDLRWTVTDPAAWTRALDTLVGHSLLTRVPAEEDAPLGEVARMNRLAHKAVSRLTDGARREAHRETVRALLTGADPGDPSDSRQWPRYAALLPHLEHSRALRSTDPRVQATVLDCLRACARGGDHATGLRFAGRVRENWSEFMDPVHGPMPALALLEGDLLRAAGRFREAHERNLLAHARLEEAGADDGPAGPAARGAVAGGLRRLGRYEDAYRLQQEVLDDVIRLGGEDDAPVLAARHDIAATLRALGRYREAHEYDTATLAWWRDIAGLDHIAALASAGSLTHDQRLLGLHDLALAHQEEVAQRHAQVLGVRHPQTLDAEIQLALCHRHSADRPRDDERASLAALLERAVDLHGPGHHVALRCRVHYADFLREHGELDRAGELATEAESGYRALLGPAHPVSAGALVGTALVMGAAGERATALTVLESALTGLTTTLGHDHPWVLGCALDTAAARSAHGRVDEAVTLGRDTLRRARRVLGKEHPLVLSCQLSLAEDLSGLGSLTESVNASGMRAETLRALTRVYGAEHPRTVAAHRRERTPWGFEPYLD